MLGGVGGVCFPSIQDMFRMKVLATSASHVIEEQQKQQASIKEQHDAILKQHAENAHKELAELAGGDHERGGKDWHEGLELSAFKDWDALEMHFKATLKKCPVQDLMRSVHAAEKVQGELRGFDGFWGRDLAVVSSEALSAVLRKAYATRVTAVLIKILQGFRKDGKAEAARSRVSKELISFKKTLLEEQEWQAMFPKILAEKIESVLAMKDVW